MAFNLGYAGEAFPFFRLAIGAVLVWAGLNISIVITENSEENL
jgi:hypothetical protein